jgi:hypothetical protein
MGIVWHKSFDVPDSKRYIFYLMRDHIESLLADVDAEGIVYLNGSKRSGKTVVLQQLVEAFEDSVYISFQQSKEIEIYEDFYNGVKDKIAKGVKVFFLDDVISLSESQLKEIESFVYDFRDKAIFVLSGGVCLLLDKLSCDICCGKGFDLIPWTYTEANLFADAKVNWAANPYLNRGIVETGNNDRLKHYLYNYKIISDRWGLARDTIDSKDMSTESANYVQNVLFDMISAYEERNTDYPDTLRSFIKKSNVSDLLAFVSLCQFTRRGQHGQFVNMDSHEIKEAVQRLDLSKESYEVLLARMYRVYTSLDSNREVVEPFIRFLQHNNLIYQSSICEPPIRPKEDIFDQKFWSFAYPWHMITLFGWAIDRRFEDENVRNELSEILLPILIEGLVFNLVYHSCNGARRSNDSYLHLSPDIVFKDKSDGRLFSGIEIDGLYSHKDGRDSSIWLTKVYFMPDVILTTPDNEMQCHEIPRSHDEPKIIPVVPYELLIRYLETAYIKGQFNDVQYSVKECVKAKEVILFPSDLAATEDKA